MSAVWRTANDADTCPGCAERAGRVDARSEPPPFAYCTSRLGCRCRVVDPPKEIVHLIANTYRFGDRLTVCGRFAALLAGVPNEEDATCPDCIEALRAHREAVRLADLRETYGHTVEPEKPVDPAPVRQSTGCVACGDASDGCFVVRSVGAFCFTCATALRTALASEAERSGFDAGFVYGLDAKVPLFPYGTLATRIADARQAAYDRWLVEREQEPK